jgi:hypothetical protein
MTSEGRRILSPLLKHAGRLSIQAWLAGTVRNLMNFWSLDELQFSKRSRFRNTLLNRLTSEMLPLEKPCRYLLAAHLKLTSVENIPA